MGVHIKKLLITLLMNSGLSRVHKASVVTQLVNFGTLSASCLFSKIPLLASHGSHDAYLTCRMLPLKNCHLI